MRYNQEFGYLGWGESEVLNAGKLEGYAECLSPCAAISAASVGLQAADGLA